MVVASGPPDASRAGEPAPDVSRAGEPAPGGPAADASRTGPPVTDTADTDDHERVHAFAERLADDRGTPVALPLKRDVAAFADGVLGVLFPQLSEEAAATAEEVVARLTLLARDLRHLLVPVVAADDVDTIAAAFTDALPDIYSKIRLDADAIVAGDPAAESSDEVISAYPGFLAIAIHRLAHQLCILGVPILPRLLSEVVHTRTGIDIHPGATIGRSFCIDHGTGIVVGETAVIGNDVKLYQGVTLGALSVAKSFAGTKRHPTIGDRVVIYANATVLGGETVVGQDSVVGGNVFLTHSVPPNSLVSQASQVRLRRVSDGFEDADFVI